MATKECFELYEPTRDFRRLFQLNPAATSSSPSSPSSRDATFKPSFRSSSRASSMGCEAARGGPESPSPTRPR